MGKLPGAKNNNILLKHIDWKVAQSPKQQLKPIDIKLFRGLCSPTDSVSVLQNLLLLQT